jgi:hypothetical protein
MFISACFSAMHCLCQPQHTRRSGSSYSWRHKNRLSLAAPHPSDKKSFRRAWKLEQQFPMVILGSSCAFSDDMADSMIASASDTTSLLYSDDNIDSMSIGYNSKSAIFARDNDTFVPISFMKPLSGVTSLVFVTKSNRKGYRDSVACSLTNACCSWTMLVASVVNMTVGSTRGCPESMCLCHIVLVTCIC